MRRIDLAWRVLVDPVYKDTTVNDTAVTDISLLELCASL